MKTSIKILLGLILAVFMVPTIFFMAFSYKLGKNPVKPYDENTAWSRVDIGPSRFIKISAPKKQLLECKLIPTDKPHYMKWAHGQGGDDSVSIRQQADTLYVEYIAIKSKSNPQALPYERSLELFVNEWQQLDIMGATVILDTTFGINYAQKQIDLKEGILHLGPVNYNEKDNDEENLEAPNNTPHNNFSSLQLNSLNSEIFINKGYPINNLALQLNNTQLKINNQALIVSASGTVSANSYLEIPGQFLAKLRTFIEK